MSAPRPKPCSWLVFRLAAEADARAQDLRLKRALAEVERNREAADVAAAAAKDQQCAARAQLQRLIEGDAL